LQLLQIIRRDVFSKFSGEVFSRMIFLLFFFYVGRKLGAIEFGSLNVAISVSYILGVLFLDPGLNLSSIHMLVEHQEDAQEIAGSILVWKLVSFFPLVMVLGAISYAWHGRLPSFYLLFLAALYTLFTQLLEYLSSVTNAYHRMDLEAFLKIFNRVLVVLLGAVSLTIGHATILLISMAVSTAAACVLAWVWLGRRVLRILPRWHPYFIREAFRIALPIAGTVIVTTVYLKWDLLILSYFKMSLQEIGWYASGFKIVEAFSALPTILGAALFPLIIQLRTYDPGSLDRLLLLSTKAVLLFALPVAATVSLFSREILLFVYGPQFLPGARVLAVLIWCVVPIFLYFYLVFVNIATGHAKHNLWAGCLALAAGLAANVVLIPRVGFIGAAWAALIANTTFALLATWKVCAIFRNASLPAMLFRLICAGATMAAFFFLLPVSLPVQLGLGLAAYIILLIALGAIGARDFSLLVRLLQLRALPQGQQP